MKHSHAPHTPRRGASWKKTLIPIKFLIAPLRGALIGIPINPKHSGMTVLEVLVAIVVLGFATSGAFYLLNSSEKIKSRQRDIGYATILVQNDIERIKMCGSVGESVNDSIFDESVCGIPFTVVRSIVEQGSQGITEITPSTIQEISLSVFRPQYNDTIARYRMLMDHE